MLDKKCKLRGVVGKDFDIKQIKKFSKRVVNYIYSNQKAKCVLVGKDNRESGDYVLSIIQSQLLKRGIEIHLIGVTTTPQLVYLVKRFKYALGIMITASHNSSEYNGIKCFDCCGKVDGFINDDIKRIDVVKYVKTIDVSNIKELYWRDIKNQLKANNINCVFDCANGSSVAVVRKIFSKQQIIGNDISGKYVNDGFGTENLQRIQAICKRSGKIGFAFDGDGDRVIAISNDGSIIDGDKILYIIATQQLGRGDVVVGTQISSMSLEKGLQNIGVRLIRSNIGANNVLQNIFNYGAMLGGEPCGHIFIQGVSDGVMVAVQLLNILNRTGLSFAELLKGYQDSYKLTININIDDIDNLIEYENTDNDMRIVVRQSDTEPIVRVFVEGFNYDDVKQTFDNIVQSLTHKN